MHHKYPMKIVTWNCAGAFRKKYHALERFDADILVIQECEDPARSTSLYAEWAHDCIWQGESKNKGIGIFPRKGNRISLLNWQGEFELQGLRSKSPSIRWHSHDLRQFLPFRINDQLTALAVWTKGKESQAFDYMGQFWKYLQIHRAELADQQTIVLGDFNSNPQWDKPDRWWSHTDTVSELSDIGLESLYHSLHKELPASETQPTFFLHRRLEKAYHIDYVFASADLRRNAKLEVGKYDDWISLSDHVPLLVEINS